MIDLVNMKGYTMNNNKRIETFKTILIAVLISGIVFGWLGYNFGKSQAQEVTSAVKASQSVK